MILTLTPAYGRDYYSKAAAIEGWTSGKDFAIQPSGTYCSIRDLERLRSECGITHLNIRYKCLSRVAVLRVAP